MPLPTVISIGEMAERTGLAVSAIRYCEAEGLVRPERSRSGEFRKPRMSTSEASRST